MSIYSVQLGFTFQTASGNALLFTATGLDTFILRDLVWCNDSATVMQAQVYLEDPGSVQYPIIRSSSAPATNALYWTGRQIIPTGWRLFGFGSLADWSVLASGYQLTP